MPSIYDCILTIIWTWTLCQPTSMLELCPQSPPVSQQVIVRTSNFIHHYVLWFQGQHQEPHIQLWVLVEESHCWQQCMHHPIVCAISDSAGYDCMPTGSLRVKLEEMIVDFISLYIFINTAAEAQIWIRILSPNTSSKDVFLMESCPSPTQTIIHPFRKTYRYMVPCDHRSSLPHLV